MQIRSIIAAIGFGLMAVSCVNPLSSSEKTVQFILHAGEMTSEPSTLTLSKVEPEIMWVAVSPQEGHGTISLADFAEIWTENGASGTSESTVNAVIVEAGLERKVGVLRLTNLDEKSGSLTFGYTGIAGALTDILGQVVVVTGPVVCRADTSACHLSTGAG